MKAVAESKTKLYMAIGLGIVAVLCVAWAVLPSFSFGNAPTHHDVSTGATAKGVPADSLDPRLRLDLLASAEEVKYQGQGKNIFRASTEQIKIDKVIVPPYKGGGQNHAQGPQVYTPPPPPPINLKFFGITNSKGEKPKAFLSQGEDVWIAHEGDVVNRHYRIIRISPRDVEVEDLLNNHRENIPLTQG
jgi:hypothetical protein